MPSYSALVGAILVGGMGTRLRSVIGDRPKPLAEVNGRPFLRILLQQLARIGMPKVVLCTGHGAASVEQALGRTFEGMQLVYSRETSPLGTAGALRNALPLLDSDPALVLNGDSFCSADLCGFLELHTRTLAVASILLTRVADTSRYGQVAIDGENRILSFCEKGEANGPGWINAGVYLLGQRLLGAIPAGIPVSLERDVFPRWIGNGLNCYCEESSFIDIGTPESYAAADAFFLK